MDYFNDVLNISLGLKIVVSLLSMEGQKVLRYHQTYLNLCCEDERTSYLFTTLNISYIDNRLNFKQLLL